MLSYSDIFQKTEAIPLFSWNRIIYFHYGCNDFNARITKLKHTNYAFEKRGPNDVGCNRNVARLASQQRNQHALALLDPRVQKAQQQTDLSYRKPVLRTRLQISSQSQSSILTTFQVPRGIAVASSIRVGQHLGAGNAEGARTAARVSLSMGGIVFTALLDLFITMTS